MGSASQLLSKLDQKHYHHSYYVPQGPQSLQLSHSAGAGQHSAAGITAVHSGATVAASGHHHVQPHLSQSAYTTCLMKRRVEIILAGVIQIETFPRNTPLQWKIVLLITAELPDHWRQKEPPKYLLL